MYAITLWNNVFEQDTCPVLSRWFLVQVSFRKCLGMHVITRYLFFNSPFFLHAVLSLSTTFPSAQTSWRVLFRFMKVVAIWLRSCLMKVVALVLLGNCIFMDEIDAIGCRQFSEGISAD
jgi:hypothetical protein